MALTLFAWFDDDVSGNLHLWCEELTAFHSFTDAATAKAWWHAHVDAAAVSPRPAVTVFAFEYETAPWFEPKFAGAFAHRPPGQLMVWQFEKAHWLSPEEAYVRAEALTAQLSERERTAGLIDWHCAQTELGYRESLARIRAYLHAGDTYQVNYTFFWHARRFGHPLALYQRLRAQQPVPHGAYLPLPDGSAILCRSPELFFQRQGKRLVCRPMKGTAPVEAMSDWRDDKTRAENVMIVDLIRNDLGRLAPAGGVRVTELFTRERYATLEQCTSTIVAAPVTVTWWEVLAALFPCGSVTGAPKRRTMELIAELETEPRGIYCGAIGYVLANGDGKAIVPIRTLECHADGHVRLGVGSGIVYDSDPSAEWHECALKTRFARALASPVSLIETMRWEPTLPHLPRWPQHWARLVQSARMLGMRLPAQDEVLLAITRALPTPLPEAPQRVRVQLDPDGRVEVRVVPLPPLPPEPLLIGWASAVLPPHEACLSSRDPLQRHKTTRRRYYDAALAAASARGWFDVLFCNDAGRVVEGARSNVFVCFDDDPCLFTPPLTDGCLDGVLRAELIATGVAKEMPLIPEDLTRAEMVYVGNALYGLRRANVLPLPKGYPENMTGG